MELNSSFSFFFRKIRQRIKFCVNSRMYGIVDILLAMLIGKLIMCVYMLILMLKLTPKSRRVVDSFIPKRKTIFEMLSK